MTEKAVILEVNERTCTVVTADGEFRQLKLRGNYRSGQEITLPQTVKNTYRYTLVAACLLLFLAAAGLWGKWMNPAVAAYVSLDINPSVEIALDKQNIVRGLNPLNDDGKELVMGLQIKGKNLDVVLQSLIVAAISKNYINTGGENVILSAVTPLSGSTDTGLDELIRESLEAYLEKGNVKAEVVVGNIPPDTREEARKAGMSAGRYMIFMNAVKNGKNVRPDDFKGNIYRIQQDQKIKVKDILEGSNSPANHKKPGKGSSPVKGLDLRDSADTGGDTFQDQGRSDSRERVNKGSGISKEKDSKEKEVKEKETEKKEIKEKETKEKLDPPKAEKDIKRGEGDPDGRGPKGSEGPPGRDPGKKDKGRD